MENTLEECPRCQGTCEGGAGGQCDYPGCKGGMVDNRPEDEDYDGYGN